MKAEVAEVDLQPGQGHVTGFYVAGQVSRSDKAVALASLAHFVQHRH